MLLGSVPMQTVSDLTSLAKILQMLLDDGAVKLLSELETAMQEAAEADRLLDIKRAECLEVEDRSCQAAARLESDQAEWRANLKILTQRKTDLEQVESRLKEQVAFLTAKESELNGTLIKLQKELAGRLTWIRDQEKRAEEVLAEAEEAKSIAAKKLREVQEAVNRLAK